jgi:hypothetical protein
MSADRWSKCPKCRDTKTAEIEKFEKLVDEAYGKVTAEKFKELNNQLSAMRAEAFKASERNGYSFREDWEVTESEDGVVEINYSGSCNICKLQTSFKHRHPFYPPEKS